MTVRELQKSLKEAMLTATTGNKLSKCQRLAEHQIDYELATAHVTSVDDIT